MITLLFMALLGTALNNIYFPAEVEMEVKAGEQVDAFQEHYAMHKAKNKKAECVDADINNNNAVEYLLFDAATGNSTTEEKGCIDDSNLLEI